MPRLEASRFAVPAGRIATVTPVPARASMQRCTMPSPPHTNTRSAPFSTARRASFGAFLLLGTSNQSGVVDAGVGQRLAQLAEAAAELLASGAR